MVIIFNGVQSDEHKREIIDLTERLVKARMELAAWEILVSRLVEHLEARGIENP